MKDYFGFDAIDFGFDSAMEEKYADYYILFTQNSLFGEGYVVYISKNEKELDNKRKEYSTVVTSQNHSCPTGVNMLVGNNLLGDYMKEFSRGVSLRKLRSR